MRKLLALAVSLSVIAGTAGSAVASVKVVDSYCSPSGDLCTVIRKKTDSTLVFSLRIFPKLVRTIDVCVTKRTRVCLPARLHKGPHIWTFDIRWQGNYPKEGAGRYKVRWVMPQTGDPIGPALHFRRG
jgi:hypothetical protein